MTTIKKLRWQCRRGTKELDFMLLRYLDHQYNLADASEQAQFQALLVLEDDCLLGFLLGDRDPGQFDGLVAKIRF